MKIGVITDCFNRPLDESIAIACELGLDAIQIYATTGEFSPEVLTSERKAEIKAMIETNNLKISALCADMGGYGFEREEDNAERIEKTNRITDLAVEFGVNVLTTHIGVIPAEKNEPRYSVMLKALTECGKYAASKGVTLAIETGPEKADTLLAFLEDTECGVGVNLDPANFVMVTDQDPVEAVKKLGKYIVHTHVKDGIMLKKTDPIVVYHFFAEGGIGDLRLDEYFKEVPLGEGNVDFPAYIAALKEIGYDGYLTIEREAGADPAADIRMAAGFVRELIK